jgi:hypothetical protein
MRERRYLTFDMNNPRHVEAFKQFSAQPDKMRSEYIISCILKSQQDDRMEEVIRKTLLKALAEIPLHISDTSETTSKPKSTENISDLPDVLVSAMDDV